MNALFNLARARTDWIEHVMATGGDQYLKTPEHLLPWHARHMLDVWAFLAAASACCCWVAWRGARALLGWRRARVAAERKVSGGGGTVVGDGWGGLIRPAVAAASAALAAGLVLAAAGS